MSHLGRPFDAGGAWAASGHVIEPLLSALLADPFFSMAPPKSTGRDLFNTAWLADRMAPFAGASWAAEDVQATLAELTARSASDALRQHAPHARELLVCGGGALNLELMRRIGIGAADVAIETTERAGLPPMQVEACAFAWLARAFVERRPGNLEAVTGARGRRVLGALYPAGTPPT